MRPPLLALALLAVALTTAQAQAPTISSCPQGVQVGTDPDENYATNGVALDLPQCLDPSVDCPHAASTVTPGVVTLTATIQVGALGAQAVYVPVDNAHRECVPRSAGASQAIADVCANAAIAHVSGGALLSEADARTNCEEGEALSQYCEFSASPYRFLANSVTSDVFVTLTAEDGAGNTRPCEFPVTVLDLTDPVVVCPADVTDAVTDAGQPYASEAGGLVLPPLTPIVDIATDNVEVDSLVALLETAPETCLPSDGSTSGAVFDLCQAADIAVADGQGQGGPSRVNCEGAGACTYTAPTREEVTAATQFAIGDNNLVFLAQDTAVDEFVSPRRNAAECSITVTVTDNQSPVINQDGCVDVEAFTDQDENFATVRGHYDADNNVYVPSIAFPAGLIDPCEWADMSGTAAEDMAACANVDTGGPACVYSTDSCQGQGSRYSDTSDNSGPGLSVVPSVSEQCVVCAGTDAEEAAVPTTCELSGASCSVSAGSGSCHYYASAGDVDLATEFLVGTYGCATTVLFTATDPSGNTDSCEIQVVVKDDQDPVINAATCVDTVAQADTDVAFTTTDGYLTLPSVQAEDNHQVVVTPSLVEQCIPVLGSVAQELVEATTCFLNAGSCVTLSGSGSCDYYAPVAVTAATEFPIGTVTILFTAEDGSPWSGPDICSVDVTIEDLQPPEITCPPDFLDAETNAASGFGDTASWNAAGLPTPQMPTIVGVAVDNSDPVYGGAGNGISMIVVERLLDNGQRAEISHLATGVADDNSVQFPIGAFSFAPP